MLSLALSVLLFSMREREIKMEEEKLNSAFKTIYDSINLAFSKDAIMYNHILHFNTFGNFNIFLYI